METTNKTGEGEKLPQPEVKKQVQPHVNQPGKTGVSQPGMNGIKQAETEQPTTYTQSDILMYSSISALVAGIVGYFIGEGRGERKAKRNYEEAVNKWHEKTQDLGGNQKAKKHVPKLTLE